MWNMFHGKMINDCRSSTGGERGSNCRLGNGLDLQAKEGEKSINAARQWLLHVIAGEAEKMFKIY